MNGLKGQQPLARGNAPGIDGPEIETPRRGKSKQRQNKNKKNIP